MNNMRIHHFGSDVRDVINIDAQPSCLAIKHNQEGTRITNLQVNHLLHQTARGLLLSRT